MKKYLISAAVAAVAFGAAPALADTPQGPRVEALVGADIFRIEIPGISSPTVKLEDTGILYGLGAGYDFAVTPGVSLGADVEVTGSTAKVRKDFIGELDYGDGGTADAHYRAKPRLDLYAGGRVSFSVSPTANLYVKGGYTRLSLRQRLTFTDSTTGAAVDPLDIAFDDPTMYDRYSRNRHIGGFRVGLGGQVALFHNAYLGGEVAYSDYKHNVSRYRAALVAGLRFGPGPVIAPEPVYVAPPAPAPAPATQTCYDGSVILATDVCPAPPAPPAPAPAPGERG